MDASHDQSRLDPISNKLVTSRTTVNVQIFGAVPFRENDNHDSTTFQAGMILYLSRLSTFFG
jgi:hypothetical protein